jgi:hypothetical protein
LAASLTALSAASTHPIGELPINSITLTTVIQSPYSGSNLL